MVLHDITFELAEVTLPSERLDPIACQHSCIAQH